MMRMLFLMVAGVLMPVLASADEAQDKVIAAISAICVEGYASGDAVSAAEGFSPAVKFVDPMPNAVSYRVEIAPERYALILIVDEGAGCTAVVPLDYAPDAVEFGEAVGGARLMMDEGQQKLLFLKKHNLMTVVIDAKFRGDGIMVRTFGTSNKSAWEAMIERAEEDGTRLPDEFHRTPWLR